MDGNANPCKEFGENYIHLSKVRDLTFELACSDFATWRLLIAPHCQVQVPKTDVLVVYCPSLFLLHTISILKTVECCGKENRDFETTAGHNTV